MNVQKLVDQIKSHPDFSAAGMILCHNGVVRASSRDGRAVTGLRVHVDQDKLDRIVETQKKREGIVEILVEIVAEKDLAIGDDVMVLAVAGDIRDRVIAVLSDTLNAIKETVTTKTEFFE